MDYGTGIDILISCPLSIYQIPVPNHVPSALAILGKIDNQVVRTLFGALHCWVS